MGQRDLPRLPLAGLGLFDNLSRYGSPVLGWLPAEPGQEHLLSGEATQTAFDGMSQEDREREVAAASVIGRKLW
ncbi:hypothetical protein [Streptomyces sp. CL12]|uniref:hypothetical protein n=1 Tax=Streptomyces sp. CL12 TaxID=3391744 RepID=UPI003A801D66